MLVKEMSEATAPKHVLSRNTARVCHPLPSPLSPRLRPWPSSVAPMAFYKPPQGLTQGLTQGPRPFGRRPSTVAAQPAACVHGRQVLERLAKELDALEKARERVRG